MALSYVIQIDLHLADRLKSDLLAQGFELSCPPHTVFQGKKKELTCTLYQSGKLVVQGKQMKEFIEMYLEPELLQSFSFGYEKVHADLTPRIGVDESGKGDFFGPLVVAALFADNPQVGQLIDMGIKDSKQLSDKTIERLARSIRKDYRYQLICIYPEKYNELYQRFGNLNSLLGWAHAKAIHQLADITGCHQVLIDKFAAEHVVAQALKRQNADNQIRLTQRVRGEQDPVVAGASILARAAFVEAVDKISTDHMEKLPKGASEAVIAAGVRVAKKWGLDALKRMAKVHFSTYTAIEARLNE